MILSHELAKDFGINHSRLCRTIKVLLDKYVFGETEVYLTEYTDGNQTKSPTYDLSATAVVYLLMTSNYFTGSPEVVRKSSDMLGRLNVRHGLKLSEANPKEMKFHAMLQEFFPELDIIHKIPVGKHRIDFYLPTHSLAIEFLPPGLSDLRDQDSIDLRNIEIDEIRRAETFEPFFKMNWVKVFEGEEIRGLRDIADALYEDSSYFSLSDDY